MFIPYLATSPAALSQLEDIFTDHFYGLYSIYELYNLWYETSTVDSTIVNVRSYYLAKRNSDNALIGYYNNYLKYDTTTGLYSYGCPKNPIPPPAPPLPCGNAASATYNGLTPEQLSLLTLYYPSTGDICFPAGTPITTNQGIIPIEKIKTDFHTIDNKKIVAITKSITDHKHLVCFEKNALGRNIPSERTVMTKDHKIFYRNKFIKAEKFLHMYENVYSINYNGETLYNVLMEDYNKMIVNNLLCETLHPENKIAKLTVLLNNLSEEEYRKLVKDCSQIPATNNANALKKNTHNLKKINFTI
jgi:Hint domain